MSPAQDRLYKREWGFVRRHYRANGIDPKQADAKRHQLHVKALGADKSSKDFTNADLDKVLAAFRAVTQPDNLNAQLHAIDQPEQRLAQLRVACRDMVAQLPKVKAAKNPDAYVGNYLNSVARSLSGTDFAELDETKTARVLGVLRSRLGAQAEAARLEAANCAW